MARLESVAGWLRGGGHVVDVVSTGGTGTAEFCAEHEVVTEVQPGSFAFMDADYQDTAGIPYESSLAVVSTVISRPAPDRAVIDAGLKTLSNDAGLKTLSNDSGSARLTDAPGWSYEPAGDEHGRLTLAGASDPRPLAVGERVRLIPSHIDTTINLHDVMYAHRSGRIETVWPVAGRGKVQ
jgi:D-serine deaminase-like pyridoxal phosphate-dependent protein